MRLFATLIFLLLVSLMGVQKTSAEEVDLQLVLAIDVSSSVNYDEFGLQMRGYAAAFRDERVREAILSGPHKKIAVAVTQWAGLHEQKNVVNWTILASDQGAEEFAVKIENMSRAFPFGGTAITAALKHAYEQFSNSPHRALRRIIDLSGDGEISIGSMPNSVRDRIVANGVTINGLPILNEIPSLDKYFRDNVIGGSSAFVEVSQDYQDFSRAIAKKLAQEIEGKWYGV